MSRMASLDTGVHPLQLGARGAVIPFVENQVENMSSRHRAVGSAPVPKVS